MPFSRLADIRANRSQSGLIPSRAPSQDTASTNKWRIVSQPKPGQDGPVVAKDAQGNKTVFGDGETKQTAADGKILQWYQSFADGDGKCLIDITRVGAGDDIPTKDGVQL